MREPACSAEIHGLEHFVCPPIQDLLSADNFVEKAMHHVEVTADLLTQMLFIGQIAKG